MVAQINAVRKGLNTQKLAAMSVPMNRTARVMRVTSCETDTFLFVINFLPSIYLQNESSVLRESFEHQGEICDINSVLDQLLEYFLSSISLYFISAAHNL
jgi:hypothetical protein